MWSSESSEEEVVEQVHHGNSKTLKMQVKINEETGNQIYSHDIPDLTYKDI